MANGSSSSELPVIATPVEAPEAGSGIAAALAAELRNADAELPPEAPRGGRRASSAPAAVHEAPAARGKPRRRRGSRKLTKTQLLAELRAARLEAAELRGPAAVDAGVQTGAPGQELPPAADVPPAPPLPPDPERARRHAAHLTRAVQFAGSLLASARGDHMRLEAHELQALQESGEDCLPQLEAKFPALAAGLEWLPGVLLIVVLCAIIDRRVQAELAMRRGEARREFTPAAALPSPGA